MKRIKIQPINETMSKKSYWDHARDHRKWRTDKESHPEELDENPRANPDKLDEAMSMYEVDAATKEVQARVRKLMDIAKQVLTEQQYNVFVLLAVKDPALTEREAAKVLSITRGRVHQLWTKAREKLEVAYNTRTEK